MATTLREYVESKLVISGFAVDRAPEGEGIAAWPRGMELTEAAFIITQKGDDFIVTKGDGRFASIKLQKIMDQYLKQWCQEYRSGAR